MVYKNDGEKWRANSTTKAIQAIKKHPKEITTLEVSFIKPCAYRDPTSNSGGPKCAVCWRASGQQDL